MASRRRAISNVGWRPSRGPAPSVRPGLPSRPRRMLHDAAWDFPPGSPGSSAVRPPRSFLRSLRQIDPKMMLAWQPVTKRWVIWRRGKRGYWVCVCPVQDPDTKQTWPLDNRILGILYASNPDAYGGARGMWLQVRNELVKQEESNKQLALDALIEAKKDADRHIQIRMSGYGKSPGNKFALQERE